MANEISLAASLAAARNGAAISATGSGSIDLAGDKFVHVAQEIANAVVTPLELGDMSSSQVVSALFIRNLGADTVTLYRDVAGLEPFCQIRPGTFVLIQPAATGNIHAKTASAPSLTELVAIQY
ncbi:MAG: hypothetical protein FJ387_24685 [Verrucomicrobia bacterium]|nr:hypothetical protein [Verrucomicrobiota bacterium]